jgi:medium-chain acyl-[acyl-carrier-protein] hydrolase
MENQLVSSVEYEVRGYDCGYGGPLRPFALVNFLQEAAGVNAARLGFGMEDLQSKGRTWMLSRLDLRVDGLPRDGEKLRALTWPAGAKKLFAMRAIELRRASDDSALARAVYAYLIVDIAARRPLRPEGLFGPTFPGEGESLPVSDYAFDIPAAVDPAIAFAQRVGYRHIDHNGHANNAHILNWLIDAASSPGLELSALRVEFAAEALQGDELHAWKGEPASSAFGSDIAESSTVTELRRGDTKVARALVGLRGASPCRP